MSFLGIRHIENELRNCNTYSQTPLIPALTPSACGPRRPMMLPGLPPAVTSSSPGATVFQLICFIESPRGEILHTILVLLPSEDVCNQRLASRAVVESCHPSRPA